MNELTEAIVTGIEQLVNDGHIVVPVILTSAFPQANVSAAIRIAKARGIIVADVASHIKTPIYRKALRIARDQTEMGGQHGNI